MRYWSTLVNRRAIFFAVLWPTCSTWASGRPCRSYTVYWLLTSMIFVFCCTTRMGSSNRLPPPVASGVATVAGGGLDLALDRRRVGLLADMHHGVEAVEP